eukprot:TRINITY_DN12687_c0_g1_i1.p1 TRINITY_DN12687_c0_g1~~TRINITY_DN12687_c0_g1_i1.p1  ORF type:complete len:212 (-),score=18.98 TRINITY_DN12687_c0_g1_i1:355-990(-)
MTTASSRSHGHGCPALGAWTDASLILRSLQTLAPSVPVSGDSGGEVRTSSSSSSCCQRRRKYECAMCLLSVCSSCAGHEQSIGRPLIGSHRLSPSAAGEKRRVCDMCVMAKAHRKSEDAQPQPEGSQAPVREPTFAFEILEQGLPQKQRPSGMIPTHMLLELLGDGAPLPNQLEDLLALADENGDGFVDYKQFVAMMAARGSDVFGAEGEV